mgnify:CR=1 FL=1
MPARQESCCFTGHRPAKLPWGYNERDPRCVRLKERIADAVLLAYQEGYRHFLCGMAQGCDLYFCEAVLSLREKYPERKLFVVDTLCASMGEGLLVWHAGQLKKQGKTIEEVRDWAEENKLHLCHQFTVDDLHFLMRGGRISATTAAVGSMLKIKPVLHVNNEGKLVNIGKARGRKASLNTLVDRMEATAVNPGEQTVFISHGDSLEDAQYVARLVSERMGVKDIRINYVGPVIGAHSGPGTLALFYLGTER